MYVKYIIIKNIKKKRKRRRIKKKRNAIICASNNYNELNWFKLFLCVHRAQNAFGSQFSVRTWFVWFLFQLFSTIMCQQPSYPIRLHFVKYYENYYFVKMLNVDAFCVCVLCLCWLVGWFDICSQKCKQLFSFLFFFSSRFHFCCEAHFCISHYSSFACRTQNQPYAYLVSSRACMRAFSCLFHCFVLFCCIEENRIEFHSFS